MKITRPEKQHELLLWLGIGCIVLFFSNGRWAIPAAAWIAPVFLLRFIRNGKPARRLLVLFPIVVVLTRFMLLDIVPSSLGTLTYVLILYYAILWFLPYVADGLVATRQHRFSSTLIFPLTNVAIEYINTVVAGSWASIAYTQAGNLPLLQVLSVTGMWGVSFLVLWFGSVVNWVWENDFRWAAIQKGVLVFVSILAVALLFGGGRLAFADHETSTVRVASFTPAGEIDAFYDSLQLHGYSSAMEAAKQDRRVLQEALTPMHATMFEHTRREAQSGGAIILWPEGCTRVLYEHETAFLSNAAEVARTERVYLLVAYFLVPQLDPERSGENKCVMFDQEGTIRWTYLKTHPVPGSTDKPGDGNVPLLTTRYGRLSTAICYDMDFTSLAQSAGKAGADIMLVPAWDWKGIDPLHAVMASFRAIENGFSMVRQTGEGLSLAVDPYGATLAQMDHFTSADKRMTAQVPTSRVWTLYSSIGDVFAWICAAVFALLMVRNLRSSAGEKLHPKSTVSSLMA